MTEKKLYVVDLDLERWEYGHKVVLVYAYSEEEALRKVSDAGYTPRYGGALPVEFDQFDVSNIFDYTE